MKLDNNQKAFFELLRAGLWEQDVQLSQFEEIDYSAIYKLAEEQSVVGLVAAGLEHITDTKISKDVTLPFAGYVLQLEQRNTAMNCFIGGLIEKMRDVGIYTLLVKGQGIAQCYERPLWRACGDVDFLLSDSNYVKTKEFLSHLASNIDIEDSSRRHIEMTIDSWSVELHGTLKTGIRTSIDTVIDEVMWDVFCGGNVRTWMNGNTQVFLPAANNDIIFVFTHILQHFFVGGIGFRQICDWCRLLYTYKDTIDKRLLKTRIRAAGLESEWMAFAALAVNYLGMSAETIPLYSSKKKWGKKADRILAIILKTGNFGHNRDMTFRQEKSAVVRKMKTFFFFSGDSIDQFRVFPMDALHAWWNLMWNSFKSIGN